MRKKIKLLILTGIVGSSMLLSGCLFWDNELGKLKEAFKGRQAVIETYDENSNVIDRVEGSSISVTREDAFDTKNENGETTKKSSVLNFTIGGKSMVHVGSSLIMYEKGLSNLLEDYNKKMDIQNNDSSTPILSRIVNSAKNITTGKKRVILIRSQSGEPLATFVGNNVGYFKTDMDKTTGIQIDGKYLFIYRCDYTIYDMDLLQ